MTRRRVTHCRRRRTGYVADRVGEGLQRRDDLLAAAIALHDHDGDQPCPVCATGRLDVDRVSAMRAELADHQRDTADLHAARQRLADAPVRNAQSRRRRPFSTGR